MDLQAASGKDKIPIITLLLDKYHDINHLRITEICKQGLILLKEYPDTSKLLSFLHEISWAFQSLGNYQESLEYAFEYYNTAHEEKNRKLESSALNTIGVLYWRLSSYDDAMEYILKSLEISEEIGDRKGVASSYCNLAILNRRLGAIDTMVENYSEALTIFRELGEEFDIALVLNNLGNVYIDKDNYEKAEEACRESLKIRQKLGDLFGVSHTQISLGLIYRVLGKYKQALDILERAVNATIEQPSIIRRILKHLDLWEDPRPPPEPLEMVCEPNVDYVPWQDDVPEIEVG